MRPEASNSESKGEPKEAVILLQVGVALKQKVLEWGSI
jgi:hypothetical protein